MVLGLKIENPQINYNCVAGRLHIQDTMFVH